ncbi:MAG TPA: cbb3-type cytochrome c oxidase subunit I, partial [Polyangiales bacterium]|nr:cbb3-type cytochrome c oxidase subunit I [Polyangiales bacterium]
YYSTQRLLKTRMHDTLSRIHFYGWQLIIVCAAVTLPLGFTQAKEYAELEWPIDLAIAVVWLVFATNFFWTIAKRNEKQLYVALWFYISTIIAITVLHVVNSLAIPVSATKSYSIFGGVQDALVQWWYGHNAVAFFLTTPILGIMYYFLPKAANRPVFSYRLSIIHFWSLVFLYIWAGPHHLLNTALPDWAQTIGMIFSLMLIAPSWGGMLNGLLTLRGAWSELRSDPVLKFFAAAVTFYGMATFEGPMLSIKSVSALAHYTDWIIAHVHIGALGWNGFMAAGVFYWLIPRLYGTKLHSQAAANAHFYLATFGILLYAAAMWTSGVTQGLMWRAENPQGGLMYPSFVETVIAIRPMYWMRLIGGSLYLVGFAMMAWNLLVTARSGQPVNGEVEVVVPDAPPAEAEPSFVGTVLGTPVLYSVIGLVAMGSLAAFGAPGNIVVLVLALTCALCAVVFYLDSEQRGQGTWHRIVEGKALAFTVLTIGAVLIGGIAEIVPIVIAGNDKLAHVNNKPYHPLELEGRDVFLREGCYNCHSQMVRPLAWETARYGAASREDDSAFDHPFQWGSKRTGPD